MTLRDEYDQMNLRLKHEADKLAEGSIDGAEYSNRMCGIQADFINDLARELGWFRATDAQLVKRILGQPGRQ